MSMNQALDSWHRSRSSGAIVCGLMSTRVQIRVLLIAVLAIGFLYSGPAEAQPGGQGYPPQPAPQPAAQPAPYYGGSYAQMPDLRLLTLEEREIYWRGEITPLQTIGGGLVAAWVGFGLGHAVQGRYSDVGWMFTMGEVAAISVAVFGAVQLGENDFRQNDGAETLLIGGFLAYGILRVWEIVDTLVGPSSHNRRYRALKWKAYGQAPAPRYGLFVTPSGTRGGGTAGLSIRF